MKSNPKGIGGSWNVNFNHSELMQHVQGGTNHTKKGSLHCQMMETFGRGRRKVEERGKI